MKCSRAPNVTCPGHRTVQQESSVTCERWYVRYWVLIPLFFICCLAACDTVPDRAFASPSGSNSTARSAPTSSLIPSPTSTPTALPTPTRIGPDTVRKRVTDYVYPVLVGQYMKAYGFLSADVRVQEPYAVFVSDPEYTLYTGCWKVGQIFVAQGDAQTWEAGVEMTQVACDDDSPIAYFYWHFRLQVQGELVITSIGLYPTAPGN